MKERTISQNCNNKPKHPKSRWELLEEEEKILQKNRVNQEKEETKGKTRKGIHKNEYEKTRKSRR